MMNEKEIIDLIVNEVSKRTGKIGESSQPTDRNKLVPIGVSNRHLHLSKEHLEYLMGSSYNLEVMRELRQPGQFASTLTVTLIGSKGIIQNVRVLGPCRGSTQVEISRTDSFTLGLNPPLRVSGNTKGSAGCLIYANGKTVTLDEGVIIAARHLHLHTSEGVRLGLKTGDIISVRAGDERGVIFNNTAVRVGDGHKMEFHLDTDEANAANVSNGEYGEIIV